MSIRVLAALLTAFGIGLASVAAAADKMHTFPVKHALQSKVAKERLVEGIPVYMEGQRHPSVKKRWRAYRSNKRSNGAGKSDQEACDVAFLSAVIALQERAEREGGNAVIDIYSATKNKRHHSAETYTCNAGRAMVNVVLMGTVVRIER